MNRTAKVTIALAFFWLSISSCKKDPAKLTAFTPQSLIQAAKAYFDTHLQQGVADPNGNARIKAAKQPYWEAADAVATAKGPTVIVPVIYQQNLVVMTSLFPKRLIPLNSFTKLVMFRSGPDFYAELVTYFPDTTDTRATASAFSGIIFTETWQGTPLKKYKIAQGLILTETPSSQQNANAKTVESDNIKQTTGILAQCNTIYGYNYSADDPSETYPWSEPAGCDYEYLSPEITGPGIPPLALSGLLRQPAVLPAVIITPPNNIIGNIQDYIKCFSNYGGSDHTYQVMLCVDQPVPGSRAPWATTAPGVAGSSSGTNPIDAGHTFLVFSENFSGYSIVRNVGFYPQSNVYSWSTSAQGQLNNDDGHPYNISLTITLDNGQFFNMLNYVSQGNNAGYMYDLNTNNCSTFALGALQAGDVNLHATIGSWPGGGFGYDPGDLGEDIRNMPLSSNMTRNTTYNDHPNKYNCN